MHELPFVSRVKLRAFLVSP